MDIEQFKQSLLNGDELEAREFMEQFLASQISKREQTQALLALAQMHMEVENTLNYEYLKILRNAITELSKIEREEGKLNDEESLASVRKELS